jgi:fatty-acyl-CoA synthase
MDAGGFYYFTDRIGDTFRWKGENVAASEVAAALLAFPGIAETSVYGVRVPGVEGAAGMAVLVTRGPLNVAALREHLADRLPPYARPLFLRITQSLEVTATFKQNKHELVRDGFDPARTHDTIYFDDPERQAYVPLDAALYAQIGAGKVRI